MSDVDRLLADPGYTPSAKHVPRLVELLGSGDDATVTRAARALVRLGEPAVARLAAAFEASVPPLRGRLVDALGDLAKAGHGADEVRAFLLKALGDDDAKTRRNAVIALGHHEHRDAERALLEYWRKEARSDHRRSVAKSLARVGGDASLALMRLAPAGDPELARACREAVLALERRSVRDTASTVDGGARPARDLVVVAHCRKGLEALCAEEFGNTWRPRVAGSGRVEVALRGPLRDVFVARTMTEVGFPLAPRELRGRDDAEVLAEMLTGPEALGIFQTFTKGTVRYRVEWAGAGHRRGATARVIDLVSRKRPALVNDPRESTWEVVAFEHKERLLVELMPKRLDDPRFAYRKGDVPAASHPTLAAALVRVAGPRPDDVAWDPFVGSGLELCERHLAGPYARLIGRDLDEGALAVARANLDAAGAKGFDLQRGDALDPAPAGVTLVITNPPLGTRVGFAEDIGTLLDQVIWSAAKALPRGGRMVWVSPFPERTVKTAERALLAVTLRQRVALPGFDTEIQRFERR